MENDDNGTVSITLNPNIREKLDEIDKIRCELNELIADVDALQKSTDFLYTDEPTDWWAVGITFVAVLLVAVPIFYYTWKFWTEVVF